MIFGSRTVPLSEDDEWETPPKTTLDMVRLLPEGNQPVWEPFCGQTNQSVNTLRSEMIEVVYDPAQDFFALAAPPPGVVVVTNPPFTRKIDAVERLCMWGVPFVMLLPADAINQVAFHKRVARTWGHDLQVVYPPHKVHFMKGGVVPLGKDGKPGKSPFHTIFLLFRCPIVANVWLRDD